MSNIRNSLKESVLSRLEAYLPGDGILLFNSFVILWIALCAFVLHFFMRSVVHTLLKRVLSAKSASWISTIPSFGLFGRLSFILQGAVVQIQANLWLDSDSFLLNMIKLISDQWIILFALLSLFSILDVLQAVTDRRASRVPFPLRGLLQTIKLIASVLTGLLAVSLLLGKSPLILLSGLGALSAVLLLVFKDPILGLVAGIQLSANNMLAVGDWLEMPKYNADGDVIEIALTTVKVRNWDKTITMIPTYALISDSFKNWRGMSETGGRRIKRSILLESSSIRFLDEQLIEQLQKSDLLSDYIDEKKKSVEQDNNKKQTDMSVLMNGRRLTNVGTFRGYLVKYLKSHPKIHQGMTLLVRQLDPSVDGLPIEIYAFTTTTNWHEYEDIQSDIFDHVFSILSEFDLRAHETPTGNDVRLLVGNKA